MARWGVWLCGVLWVVPWVLMLYWLSSRAAQTFSFDTTIFPQEIPNHWHRTWPEITLTSARDVQEMLPLLTSKQTFLKETQMSMLPLYPCAPLYPAASPSISQLCNVVCFEMPSPSHQNLTLGYFSFHSGGNFVFVASLQLPTPNYCRLNSRDVRRSGELLSLSWLRDFFPKALLEIRSNRGRKKMCQKGLCQH